MNESDYKVQSLLFDKSQISLQDAMDWVISHKDKIKKIVETETQYRFQQFSQDYLRRKAYTEYRTKRLNNVVSLVIAYKR